MRFWAMIFGFMFGIYLVAIGLQAGGVVGAAVAVVGAAMAAPLLIGAFSGG